MIAYKGYCWGRMGYLAKSREIKTDFDKILYNLLNALHAVRN